MLSSWMALTHRSGPVHQLHIDRLGQPRQCKGNGGQGGPSSLSCQGPHIRGLGYGLTLLGLTFWGCELNVILLAEGGWEDGMGGGVVAEPIGAICGGPPIHTDH